ncbi:MAG: DUF2157 domain-containing protein [Nitrospirae bacterium]|nr:DUF2157 domain-containing protein [Nitrospirota bacterium]
MNYNEDYAGFLRKLRVEMGSWIEKGFISYEQRDKILSHYNTVSEVQTKAGSGRLITVVSVLGSILVGLGIILFVASNWHLIPKIGKLALLFSTMIGAYGAGYYMRYVRQNYVKVGASLIFLGTMAYGANIYLIAQIYNISVHYPNGELLWVLGTLPLAYLLRFRTILTLALVNLLIWLGMEASFWMREPQFFSSVTAFIPLYLSAGLTLTAVGLAHRGSERFSHFHGPYLWLGTIVTMSSWYIFTFGDMFRSDFSAPSLMLFYGGMLVIFACALTVAFLFDRQKKTTWFIAEAASLVFLMAVILLLAFNNPAIDEAAQGVARHYGSAIKSGVVTFLSLSSNLLFAAAIIGMIALGFARKAAFYINVGLLFFVLDVFARYFDFFWKMLPRSLFFVIGGLMLIFGSLLLERKRKRVLASFNMKEEL